MAAIAVKRDDHVAGEGKTAYWLIQRRAQNAFFGGAKTKASIHTGTADSAVLRLLPLSWSLTRPMSVVTVLITGAMLTTVVKL